MYNWKQLKARNTQIVIAIIVVTADFSVKLQYLLLDCNGGSYTFLIIYLSYKPKVTFIYGKYTMYTPPPIYPAFKPQISHPTKRLFIYECSIYSERRHCLRDRYHDRLKIIIIYHWHGSHEQCSYMTP